MGGERRSKGPFDEPVWTVLKGRLELEKVECKTVVEGSRTQFVVRERRQGLSYEGATYLFICHLFIPLFYFAPCE